jgi:hypothetical protein
MARKTRKSPAETRRNLLNRKFPPCPFCGEIPTYPAHKNYCYRNPEAKANRDKVASEAKKAYVENGMLEKVQAGNAKHRDRLIENGRRVSKRRWEEGNVYCGTRNAGKTHSPEARAKISAAKKRSNASKPVTLVELQSSLRRANVVMPMIDDRSLLDHPFFQDSRKLPDSEGWIEVDQWSIDDE